MKATQRATSIWLVAVVPMGLFKSRVEWGAHGLLADSTGTKAQVRSFYRAIKARHVAIGAHGRERAHGVAKQCACFALTPTSSCACFARHYIAWHRKR